MKIGYILTMRKGLPAFVYREVSGLLELGHEVLLYITRSGRGPYMPQDNWQTRRWNFINIMTGAFLEILRSPLRFFKLLALAVSSNTVIDFIIAFSFIKKIRKDKPDVLLCFEGLHCLRIGYYCFLFTQTPISVIVHAEMLRLRTHREFTRKALLSCEKIISPTELNCRRISSEFDVPSEKVVLNHMSVDTVNFKHDERLKILIIAYFAQRKGHETLLRAIEYLNRNDIVLWVVGGEVWGNKNDMFDVKGFVKEHQLEEKVILFGRVNDESIHQMLDSCDVFCLPCRTPESGVVEGLPVAIMEAMSYSKPVISTKHTGIPELLPDILIEENDYKALAEGIMRLKDDPELRKKMGLRNRKIIEDSYSSANIKSLADILLENKI